MKKRTLGLCLIMAGLLLSGCGSEQLFGPAATITPTKTTAPTKTQLPTATATSAPLLLPQTTQPKCSTVLTSFSPDPNEITDLHQSEITFILTSNGYIQSLVNKYGNYVIEQLEINEVTIGGKNVALADQQLSNGYLQTTEFGSIVIISGDPFGSCMVMVVTPDQFTQIVNWLQ